MAVRADPGVGKANGKVVPISGASTGAGRIRTRGPGGRVLVLNASYEPINVCTMRRAAVLVLKERAEVIERREGVIHSERLELERPCVIRLVRYVRVPRDVHRRKITRRAVLARDAYTCQYCGRESAGLTVDHVIPRSRGGTSHWDNIVAACAPCNRKKGNRLPNEAAMPLRAQPQGSRAHGLHPHRQPPRPRRVGAVPPGGLGAKRRRAAPSGAALRYESRDSRRPEIDSEWDKFPPLIGRRRLVGIPPGGSHVPPSVPTPPESR